MRRKLLHRRGGESPDPETEKDVEPRTDSEQQEEHGSSDDGSVAPAATVDQSFAEILTQELQSPTTPEPVGTEPEVDASHPAVELREPVKQAGALSTVPVDQWFEAAPEPAPARQQRFVPGMHVLDFWDRYDEATAAADLFAVPPAAITAVVGSLTVAIDVVRRCRASHWVSECDVFVLTARPEIVGEPTWTTLRRPSDVVAVLEGGKSDFPLIVVDVPRELPAWVRPLLDRLRDGGVGLVHYVLDSNPSDEDLATWHGELGRPSVLDLAKAVPPERVLELLDRGEPIASVGGRRITPDLLLALRLSATSAV